MRHAFRTTLAAALAAGTASVAYAADPMVGGAPMMASKTIVENASQAKNLTTLVAAVKEAGLVDTLSGPGPFTVFAPTNAAFDKLPKATVEGLMKPDMKADLQKILTYHVVAGKIDAAEIARGSDDGRPRNKFTNVADMLAAAATAQPAPPVRRRLLARLRDF